MSSAALGVQVFRLVYVSSEANAGPRAHRRWPQVNSTEAPRERRRPSHPHSLHSTHEANLPTSGVYYHRLITARGVWRKISEPRDFAAAQLLKKRFYTPACAAGGVPPPSLVRGGRLGTATNGLGPLRVCITERHAACFLPPPFDRARAQWSRYAGRDIGLCSSTIVVARSQMRQSRLAVKLSIHSVS